METTEIQDLIASQRHGWSLEQPFYVSPRLYEYERRGWLARQPHILAHASEIPDAGSFIVRELLGESLIIVRDAEGTARGFYNVCRHRGSKICDRDGRATSFMCPYHAWSYRLDGTLRAAAALPDGTDTRVLGLRSIPIREMGGLILGCLEGDLRHLDEVAVALEPGLQYHGIPKARIAARRNYPTMGNWKLVIENFLECYHCPPSHNEYCSVMGHVDALGYDSAAKSGQWDDRVKQWFAAEADQGSPLTLLGSLVGDGTYGATRAPIGGGRRTQSQDGRPVAPLMGSTPSFDGGFGYFRYDPFVHLTTLNDHAVFFQFFPTGPDSTNVTLTWLVDGAARDSDIDVDRMVWLWDVTTLQDKVIIERNADGVRSRAYTPGPYSKLEDWTVRFIDQYLHCMKHSVSN
jgi:phenylpropionate dioxygenase-like ring-hydroxylating dioxygenase large terminal subunit